VKILIESYPYPKDRLSEGLQSAARLLGIKFLDHLIPGSSDNEEGRGFVTMMEHEN
jgi:hypothetical protein